MDIQPSEWKLETLRCRCLFHLKYFNEFCEYVSFLKFGYVPVRGRGGGRGGGGGAEGGKKCKLFGKFCSDVLNECSLY